MKKLSRAAGPRLPGSLNTWVQAQMNDMEDRQDAALEGYLNAIGMVERDRRKLTEDSEAAIRSAVVFPLDELPRK